METTRPEAMTGVGVETEVVAPAVSVKEGTVKLFFGRLLCALGLISAVVGAFGLDVSFEAVGMVLGMLGYALGASRSGTATVVLSTIALVILLAAGQGYIPGPWPIDPLAI